MTGPMRRYKVTVSVSGREQVEHDYWSWCDSPAGAIARTVLGLNPKTQANIFRVEVSEDRS